MAFTAQVSGGGAGPAGEGLGLHQPLTDGDQQLTQVAGRAPPHPVGVESDGGVGPGHRGSTGPDQVGAAGGRPFLES